ncbi:MAG: hypothetical protein Q4E02_00835 [Lagierella massiliensis]|nr:hypothetical protein [Lagierella massiliensis]
MIILKNVRKENNKIYADYYPEDSIEFSKIEFDITNNVFTGKKVGYKLEYDSHLAHAKFALREMAKGERKIKDCTIMWY